VTRAGALALLLIVTGTGAASGITDAARAALSARDAHPVTMAAGELQTLEIAGATAAWAIDAAIVDVAVQAGRVTLLGRGAGTTKVIVISGTGQRTLDIAVTPRGGGRSVQAATTRGTAGTAEVRYSSASREVQTGVTLLRETKTKKTELEVRTVHQVAHTAGDRATTSIPTVSYRIFTRGHELTLFDREVDHSPLTLRNTPIRGVHYLDEHWRLHAGYTAYATYRSFFIPVERQLVAGGGYSFRTSLRSTLTPSFFAYPGEGTVTSLLYGYDETDRLAVRAELGYSDGLGAALQVAYDDRGDHAADHVRADIRYRPDGFAVPLAGSPRGFFSDTSWTHEYGRGSSASLVFSASDIARMRVMAASADVDHRLNDVVSLIGGASWGKFGASRSLTVPAGVRLDLGRTSVSALYRYAASSTNDGGHGFRLAARTSLGRLYANAYVDRQQNAPTLDVIFSERPDLALALDELGITATSPSDIARALREQAALVELGFIEGVTIDLAPLRTQLGFELAWLSASESRQQFRARLLRNVVEGVSRRTDSTIATLAYSRRLTASADVFASWSYWRTERRGQEAVVQPFVELGVRQRFDGLPSFLDGTGAISGIVFADDDLDGASDGNGVRAVVELDGSRTESTQADGSFRFTAVPRGSHRLVARVPERPEAYFTTPSRVEAQTGETVSFGVAFTPARFLGSLRSDAGKGIAGVRVLLIRGTQQVVATTDTEGGFSTAAAPGEWQVSILTDSVPAGFSLAGTEARSVTLSRAQPLSLAYVLRAHRGISGSGAAPNAVIEVRPLAKSVKADADGRFSIRSLPAGEVTLVSGGVQRLVLVPAEPAALTVDLAPQIAAATAAPEVRTEVTGERRDTMGYVVQLGAYRVHANAVDTAARARRSGIPATFTSSGTLTIVRAGPYRSRREADAAAALLTGSGLEAVVLSNR
jgi:hypothetical protein